MVHVYSLAQALPNSFVSWCYCNSPTYETDLPLQKSSIVANMLMASLILYAICFLARTRISRISNLNTDCLLKGFDIRQSNEHY